MVVLTAAVALWSCSGDPTDSFQGGEKIVATPTTMVVNQGTTKFVTVELIDEQGSALATNFDVRNVGPGITVVRDEAFLPVPGGTIQTSARYIVTGTGPAATTFEVVAGGVSDTINVNVLPTGEGIPLATVASTGPNATDPTVLTVPAPFQFSPDSTVAFDAGPGIIIARSEDGRSVTLLPPPGATSTGTVTLITDYLPDVPLASTTDVPLTISPTVPSAPGTGSPATAPNFDAPAPGGTTAFYDAGGFTAADITADGGVGAQYYALTVSEDGDYTITTNWNNDADIDQLLCTDATCSDGGVFVGTGLDQPETGTVTLTAGTYYLAIVLFEGTAPGFIATSITNP
jgi:hypothetical protein